MAWAPCGPLPVHAAKASGVVHARGDDGQLWCLLPPTPAFWVNGGLTCLELSRDYLSASVTPISKEGDRTEKVLLVQMLQEHSMIRARGDGYFIILQSMRLIEG